MYEHGNLSKKLKVDMENSKSILIVEDEPKILSGLKDFLEFHGFGVSVAADGLEAERVVRDRRFDLILLDLMLPKISGEQLCMKWRRDGVNTPIIMLTAKGLEKERIAGLDLGADDYVTKPFSLEELRARIEAILRRTAPERSVGRKFEFGSVKVDVSALKVIADDCEKAISTREAKMIQFFAANPGRVITRDELYENVWGESMGDIETRTVDVHIAVLRGKIEVDHAEPLIIKTVRGAGYIYESGESNV